MKFFILIILAGMPLWGQAIDKDLTPIQGFWRQIPPAEIFSDLIEESYFEFFADGNFYVAINNGTEKNPSVFKTGEGFIHILKSGSPALVEITLNEEVTTNTIGIMQDGYLRIFSSHEQTGSPVEKIKLERVQRP